MANRLKMAVTETIQTLRRRGWSARRIARELGVDRETVARQLRAPPADSNAAIAPAGSASADDGSNAAIAPPPVRATPFLPNLIPFWPCPMLLRPLHLPGWVGRAIASRIGR